MRAALCCFGNVPVINAPAIVPRLFTELINMGFNRALGTIHLLASQTVGHIQRQLDAFSIHFELVGMQNVFLAQSLG